MKIRQVIKKKKKRKWNGIRIKFFKNITFQIKRERYIEKYENKARYRIKQRRLSSNCIYSKSGHFSKITSPIIEFYRISITVSFETPSLIPCIYNKISPSVVNLIQFHFTLRSRSFLPFIISESAFADTIQFHQLQF